MIQSFKMAVKSISGNKFRAFLTMLGIIIGVMALVILVSLVEGATGTVTDTIASLGNDIITVTISDDKGKPVTLSVLDQWMDDARIGAISASATSVATGKSGAETGTVTVYGVTPAYADVNGLTVNLGRFLKSSDLDNHTAVAVINETTATELIGYKDCLGETISLNGMRFTVVGILANNDESLTAAFTKNSFVAYIPHSSLLRMSETAGNTFTTFTVSAAGEMASAEAAIKEKLMERFDEDEDAFDVNAQNILEDAMGDVTGILTVLLGGIAAISLIVGGIGIMNIMLVTVTERTREIGIRKAIGASRGVILQQFLLESVMLCMLGCAIGVFMSWSVLRLITMVVGSLGLVFDLAWNVVLLAVAFCFAIGIIFGLYPANKAAKMSPIDALHYGG